jgi:tetratricopeptide (TPR) repeat protein
MAQVIDNLSQGWRHMVTHCHPGKGSQFCAETLHNALFSISLFYEMRCRSLEAIDLFQESVEHLKTVEVEFEAIEDFSRFTAILGHITAYLGLHHYYIFQYEKTIEYLKEAVQLLDNIQYRVEKAQAQVMHASVCLIRGQLHDAVSLLEHCREVFREEGAKWWYALSTAHLASNFLNLGKLQESEALFQEASDLVEPGDLRSVLPLRNGLAYVLILKGDYDRAEQILRDNLQLSYQFGNFRLTSMALRGLGRVTLATERIEMAVEYIQKSIHLLTEFGETRNLAAQRIDLGKCFAARSDFQAARDQFLQVIKNGQESDRTHLVCDGLVNIARIYLAEGQTKKALEISLALRYCPTEFFTFQDECIRLQKDLEAALQKDQLEAMMKQVDGLISSDQTGGAALAYALNRITEENSSGSA